jgi:hypothetical protein
MKITTLRTMAGTNKCPDIESCPAVLTTDTTDDLFVVTRVVDDPAVLAEFAHLVGPGEQLGYVPRELLKDLEV